MHPCMKISASVLQKLLVALKECTEWGQVFILDSLAKYTPAEAREIIKRITPRLQRIAMRNNLFVVGRRED